MSDAPTPPIPSEFGVYFALLEVSALVQHGVERQLRVSGDLSFTQFQILAMLGEDPSSPSSMTDLADRLVHSRSGLTYQVDRLEQAGLVDRVPSADDERSVNVRLTSKGSSLLARVLPGHVEVVRDVLIDAIDGRDRDELTRLLGIVAGHMRSRPPRSARRFGSDGPGSEPAG
ncbi:MarR family winged helix-turn-helix transcriptional regulator [Agromyces albus]|uniref:MarR family winged helix-turn-helix transcriptional regulator n=1 Tax=Agromyces albus TaxID=205332 RepID=UPI002788CF31|nr:MarR family winged helix-turn-helix transcriptional regulator [Agromyces albus]MDQ0574219.1 DNA-binding MarR family transcriptional regulator [Agromyces albus]